MKYRLKCSNLLFDSFYLYNIYETDGSTWTNMRLIHISDNLVKNDTKYLITKHNLGNVPSWYNMEIYHFLHRNHFLFDRDKGMFTTNKNGTVDYQYTWE